MKINAALYNLNNDDSMVKVLICITQILKNKVQRHAFRNKFEKQN